METYLCIAAIYFGLCFGFGRFAAGRRIYLLEFHAMARVLGRDPVELFSEVAAELAGLDAAAAEP